MGLLKGTPLLQKHKGRYNVVFYDRETKRQIWHSLGTNKKDVADRRFREIVRAYEENRFDPKKERYEFGRLTLRVAADRFLAHGKDEKHWTDATYTDYDDFMNLVCSLFPADMMLSQFTPSDCKKVVRHPPAHATRRGYYTRLHAFLNVCVKVKLLAESPMKDIKKPKEILELPEYFTREEVAAIVAEIERMVRKAKTERSRRPLVRLRRVVQYDVASGLRLGELRRLAWKDVDRAADRMSALGKGGKYRPVPLFKDARDVLDEIEQEHIEQFGTTPHRDQKVFVGLPYSDTSNLFKEILRELKFGEEYSFHSLRKTFASWAVMGGTDIYVVSRWLGHEDVSTTQRSYAHLAPDYVPATATATFGG